MPIIATNLDILLSSRHIVLWVEDTLTREYLRRVWQPDDLLFQILIAGSIDNVTAAVRDLQENGYGHVFGFTDRDFRSSNRSQWNDPSPNMYIYRPDRLEMENYLLDWVALAECDENKNRYNRSPEVIQNRVTQYAQNMLWWMACRQVIYHCHERLTGHFPEHPKVMDINSFLDAKTYIKTTRGWWNRFPEHAAYIQNPDNLTSDLHDACSKNQNDLNDGTWVKNFSGKEIFRMIRGFLFNRRYDSNEVMDTDLAKSVADWQIENDAVPVEIMELKKSIMNRVGL